MTVKELIKALRGMPGDLPVVLCDLNNDGDGDGMLPLPEVMGVELMTAENSEKGNKEEDCVFITFEGMG